MQFTTSWSARITCTTLPLAWATHKKSLVKDLHWCRRYISPTKGRHCCLIKDQFKPYQQHLLLPYQSPLLLAYKIPGTLSRAAHRIVDKDVAVITAARHQLVIAAEEGGFLDVRGAVAVPRVPADLGVSL